MKLACVQFSPVLGDVAGNIKKLDGIIAGIAAGDLDLMVLPELALTGYNFPNLRAIKPHLEIKGEGPSSLWAQRTAQRLKCVVSVGYPEKAHPPAAPGTPARKMRPSGLDKRYNYNSNIIYGPDGNMLGHYRKCFLYLTDVTWASEPLNYLHQRDGFFADDIAEPLNVKLALGICMDINPYQFSAPTDAMEFANHVCDCKAELAVVSMAWSSIALSSEDVEGRAGEEPDLKTLEYWFKRFEPVINGKKSVVLAMGNRCGVEDDTVYTGSSMIVRIGGGNIEILDVLGKGEEQVLITDTERGAKYSWQVDPPLLIPQFKTN